MLMILAVLGPFVDSVADADARCSGASVGTCAS